MVRLFYKLFGTKHIYAFATVLDTIKNFGAGYLLAAFVGWSFNPMDWSLVHTGIGRFVLLLYILFIIFITFKEDNYE